VDLERPDLSDVSAEVAAYIAALEAELVRLQPAGKPATVPADEPSEPPTTMQVITITAAGRAKRTARHHYTRQRRGGMGVFDIDAGDDDRPAILVVADEADTLLLFTNKGRVFRLPVERLPQTPVRGRGSSLADFVALHDDEQVRAALADDQDAYVVIAAERGWVRRLRASFVGRTMFQGTTFHDVIQGGELTAACWSSGEDDLFLVTQGGKGLRFTEHHVRDRKGTLGMRVDQGDKVVGVATVQEDGSVFLLNSDGKGTIRLMEGFRTNKAPGAGGKVAIRGDEVVGVVPAGEEDDLFIISGLSKIIRFTAAEVPPKTGVVQGVNCISLRADEAVAIAVSPGQLASESAA
jgi:DNA gyrase subunit A